MSDQNSIVVAVAVDAAAVDTAAVVVAAVSLIITNHYCC